MDTKMTVLSSSAESKCLPSADSSVAICIAGTAETKAPISSSSSSSSKQQLLRCWFRRTLTRFTDNRNAVHSAKVGLALVLVSLLYMLEVVHDRLGDNAMWAVMTVVVVFEFTSGATISKGINRGIGTILGGGLGSMVALLAQEISGAGKAVAIGTSVFIFGAAATYTRMVPNIKKKYDYGVLIFILTFSLIAVSGIREDEIIKIASDRLSSICMGFGICLSISLFVFPVWSGNELHNSMASKFDNLACSIEECLDDHIKKTLGEKTGNHTVHDFTSCLAVLSSKTSDETMAKFAKWEPWHGRFGLYHPWNKYLEIGDLLRQLAASIISMKGHLRSEKQVSAQKEQYETTCSLLAYTMRELGGSIHKMIRCQQGETITSKLRTVRLELCSSPEPLSNLATVMNHRDATAGGNVPTSSLHLLVEIVEKVEELVREVDELGKTAGYTRK